MQSFIEEVLRPQAAGLDQDPALLKAAWDGFVGRGLHRFTDRDLWQALGPLAEASGAFAFLALQQIVAGSQEVPAGVAFGHLRNPHSAAPVWENGCINGIVPWLTGAGIFGTVLLGFRLTDGSEVKAWVDARDRETFRHSAPLPLLALRGTNTVAVTLQDLPLDEADFVSVDPPGTQAANDAASVIYQTPLLLGACRATVHLIEQSGRGDAERARQSVEALANDIDEALNDGTSVERGPILRARAGDLSVRLARLACMSCGGASLLQGHPAERLHRETLVYSLMAQTDQIVHDAFEVLP